jgi:23S rRNA (uracil1939-C5)-methyltransferase
VYGIEVASAAVADAVRNARENGIENCTFLPGEVRHVLPTLMRDGIPRRRRRRRPAARGVPSQGSQRAGHARPGADRVRLVQSVDACARDVGDLVRQGYRLEWVEPVDMFPQTPHIEAVARLRRAP